MIYRAIIKSLENDGYQAKVQIPYFDKTRTNTYLYTACICVTPGCAPAYVPGDIVYVTFEENDIGKPLILGCLFRKDILSSVNITSQSLNVTIDSTLPEDTSIGEVTKDNIKALTLVDSNIQSQLDFMSTDSTVIIEGDLPLYDGETNS